MKRLLNFDRGIRAVADLLMLNVSFLLSDIIIKAFFPPVGFQWNQFFYKLPEHIYGMILVNIIALIVFHMNGFYTRSRAYQSRYKALVIVQAVCVCYLIFGFANYLVDSNFISPAVLILSWVLSIGFLVSARLWSLIWRKVILNEVGQQNRAIQVVNDKEVLVIGGAGYIGSALLPLLLEEGYSVRILDAFIYGDSAIKPYLTHPKVKIYRADFRQIDKIVEAVKGVNSVIHLGALVGDPACALDENLTIEINLMATRMIAEVCKGFGVRNFIFASTCSVYGASDDVLDERSKLNPVSLYARSKIACEKILLELASDKFSPVILRFSTIFGFSGRTRFDLVVNLLTAKAYIDQEITVINGDQWRPFLHVEDAARSVVAALKAPRELVHAQVYNVGNNNLNYTLLQMGELVAHLVPNAKLILSESDQDRRNYRVDCSKIQRDLKYFTKWTLEDGIRQMIKAFAENKLQDYKSAEYSNVKSLMERGAKDQLSAQSILNFQDLLIVEA
ncbi:MAG: NAD-dependent epimerase/dehydratase [Gammaproteobacteria bacterium]|jgi:nucleoside-diphosphate-sugar epimerase|nr:NAD-dependent epimerase/dehydratase [Gammaproteobacteria bacterium]